MTQPAPEGQRRAVIAAAAVLAILAAAGIGVLIARGGSGADQVLAPTPAPTAAPSPSPEPSPSPSPTPEPTPTQEPWEVSDAFLPPEAASEAEEPGWAEVDHTPEAGPLLDPCAGDDIPLRESVAASDERALGAEQEAGGREIVQEVFRYTSGEDAAEALRTYRERVEQCPRKATEQDELDDEIESTVVEDASAEDRLLVRQRYCNPACTDLYTTYTLVASSGDGLTVLRYALGQDGDPEEGARALLDAAHEQLRTAVTP